MRSPGQQVIPAYNPIADYAVIGDMQAAALIASDGSIDWACLPYFDSPAVVSGCLTGGRAATALSTLPTRSSTSRRYIEGTNILETAFTARSGSLVMTDFMPLRSPGVGQQAGRIVRLLRCTSGSVDLSMDVKPTFAFASDQSRIHSREPDLVVFEGRDHCLLLHSTEYSDPRRRQSGRDLPARCRGNEVRDDVLQCIESVSRCH